MYDLHGGIVPLRSAGWNSDGSVSGVSGIFCAARSVADIFCRILLQIRARFSQCGRGQRIDLSLLYPGLCGVFRAVASHIDAAVDGVPYDAGDAAAFCDAGTAAYALPVEINEKQSLQKPHNLTFQRYIL